MPFSIQYRMMIDHRFHPQNRTPEDRQQVRGDEEGNGRGSGGDLVEAE
jgi:hypothetical protein